MSIQYVMRAFNTVLNHHVSWSSINSVDSTGAKSGYPTNQLTNITVNYSITVPDTVGLGPLELLEGSPGPAGDGYFSALVGAGNITAGKAILISNGKIAPFSLSLLSSAGGLGGIALSTTNIGLSGGARTNGPDATIASLGNGYACAVGVNSSGTPVRVTDATCVTGLNYLGYCDGYGTITVSPRRAIYYDVVDFGAIGDGVTDNTTAIQHVLNVAAAVGGTVHVPATGSFFKITSAITIPANASMQGDFSQNGGYSNVGSIIYFTGSGTGFIMGGASITIKNLVLFTDLNAGPHILQETGTTWGYWQIDNVRMVCGNKNKSAILLGANVDGYGVENNWSTFNRIDIFSAAQQAVPLIQLYGADGGLSNMSMHDCVLTGGGLAGSGNESTAEFIHVESTDAGLIVNMEFHNISFEVPIAGAFVFKSVNQSKITNCWAGDLNAHNPTAPLIYVGQSSHSGAGVGRDILIDTLFTDIGNNTSGQETLSVEFGNYPVTVINSKLPSINNGGYSGGIITLTSTVNHVINNEQVVGISDAGTITSQVAQLASGSIILQNGLNSDVGSGIPTSWATVITTAVQPVLLGGLTLGSYGDGTEFTLFYNHNQPLTIVNEDGYSTAAYRITTLTGQNIVAGNSCVINFIYNGASSRWLLQNIFNSASGGSIINVKTFGATGNGTTDDTNAIQIAINTAQANGGTIFFPIGTYKLSSTLTCYSGVSLVGESRPKWIGAGQTGPGSWFTWSGSSTDNMIEYVGARDWVIEKIGIMGGRGGAPSSLNAIYMAGTPATPNFQQRIQDCIIDEVDICILWGEGDGYQADSSSIENCELYNFTTAGIKINSVNAADASKIERCGFSGAGGWGIDINAAGFIRIVDCDAGGGAMTGGFIRVNASTNPVTIENCEAEGIPYFLYVGSGAGDSSIINLKTCYTNQPIYLGSLVRVVSIGSIISGTLTLDSSGAKWLGFGDRIIETLGGKLIVNSGIYHNQDLLNSSVGTGFQGEGQVNWNPYYWWGAAQGDGTSLNKIGAEWNTRSGIRGAFWNIAQTISTGSYNVPSVDNGHAYQAQNSGTTGGSEPSWPTGSGSTVNDNGITWKEVGTAALFVPFAPLNHSAGTTIPTEGYWQVGAIRWNTSPVASGNIGWVCVTSGNPGTWKTFGTIQS